VESIGNSAFQHTGLTKLTVEPGEVPMNISDSVFNSNAALKEVTMPDDVNITSGTSVFGSCSDIALTITCHSGTVSGKYLFSGGYSDSAVTSVVVEEGITTITNNAFNNMYAMKRVDLPESLKEIGTNAFYGCKKLASVALPAGLETLGKGAFYNCGSLASVRLPEGLTDIGESAFYRCSALTSINLPSTLTTIGASAFYSCSALDSVDFPASLTTINSSAFQHSGLDSLTLVNPDAVITLSTNAFGHCPDLRFVTLGDNVKINSGSSVFSGCSGLEVTIACINGTIPERFYKTADYSESAVRILTLEEGITSVGASAFRNLEALNVLNLPKSLTSIGSYAFSGSKAMQSVMLLNSIEMTIGTKAFDGVTDGVFFIAPDSTVIDYLEENNFLYAFYAENSASALFNLPEGIDPADLAGMKLQLTNSSGDAVITCLVSADRKEYTFQGLTAGNMYGLRLTDKYGSIIAETAPAAFAEGENTLAFESIPALVDLTATVLAPDGTDVTGSTTLTWHNAAGKRILQGASLENIAEGTALTLTASLSDELLRFYKAPEASAVTVSADNANVILQLAAHDTAAITGTVLDASDATPLSGARVTAMMNYGSGVTGTVTGYTGSDGSFALEVNNVPGTLVFSAGDYLEQRMDLASYIASPADISLVPVRGLTIGLDISLYYAAAEGEEPAVQTEYQNRNAIEYSLYDLTKGAPITGFTLNNGEIVITDGADAGDAVRLTAASIKGMFAPVSVDVVLSDTEAVTAKLDITGYGRVHLTRASTDNTADAGMLYNTEGRLVREMAVRYGEALAIDLEGGEYTLLVMGADNSFAGVNRLESFLSLGLTEGTDYLACPVTVEDGVVTLCAVDHIPASAKGRESYVDEAATVFSSNKDSNALGLYFALKAQTALKEEYAGASDLAWEFTLPDNLLYYANSLSVNGSLSAYSQSGRTLRVAVGSPEDLVRLCLLSVESGNEPVSAVFTFTHGGKTYRQPIGNLPLEVTDMMVSIPEETSSTSFTVYGTTVYNSEVEIYDNGALVGTATSKSDGTWRTQVTLPDPGACSGHLFRVKVTTPTGKVLTSQPHALWYSIEALEVSKVYMQMSGRTLGMDTPIGSNMAFDFIYPNEKAFTYNFSTARPIFTFAVEFTGGDPADASNVKVHVQTDRTDSRVLDCVYYEATRQWVASDRFPNGLPVNVGVSFDQQKNNTLVYSPESAKAELEKAQATIAEQGSAINFKDEVLLDTIDGNTGNFVEAISFTDAEGNEQAIYLISSIEPISQEDLNAVVADANMSTGYSFLGIGYDYENPLFYMNIDETADGYVSVGVDPNNKTRTVLKLSVTNPMTGVATAEDMGDFLDDLGDLYDALEDLEDRLDDPTPSGPSLDDWRDLGNDAVDQYTDDMLGDIEDLLNNSPNISSCLLNNMREDYNKIREQIKRAGACSKALGWFEKMHKNTGIGLFGDAAMNMGKLLGTGKLKGLKDLLEFHENCPDNFANNNCIPVAPINLPTIDQNCEDDPDSPYPPRNPNARPGRDPSGYVYEAVASNRLMGVTAYAYQRVTKYDMYDEPYIVDELWDATEFSQVNPMNTDALGAYGWDVPEGLWQVRYEKEGYEDAASAWMEVPPIRTEVNIGMVSYVQPEVKKAAVDFDAIDITFTKYMDLSTLNTDNITASVNGAPVSGSIELLNAEASPANPGVSYASKVRFVPDTAFESGAEVTLTVSSRVRSYAGVAMAADYTLAAEPAAQPRTLYATEILELNEGGEGVIKVSVLPMEAGAGRKVSVSTTIGVIELSDTSLVLDENGAASVTVSALMPGSAPVIVALEDTDLYMECSVNVTQNTGEAIVATPTASLPAGSYVPEGSVMELFCETPDALIYYTVDDTCPCNSETRILYTGPIVLTESATLRACAEKEGMAQSSVLKVPFTVTAPDAGVLVLPASLTSIEDEAFIDCAHIQQVIVPDGATYIGVRAFQSCISLRKIVIPDSVTWIRNCAFNNCPQVVIWCSANSYVHEFAVSHDLDFNLMD